MDYREKRRTQMRTSMDLVMGVFYIGIGGVVVFAKSFGNMAIPALVAYILGSMMIIGGAARLYRGIKTLLPQKNDADQ